MTTGCNIVLVGVGGQGSVLAGRIIAGAALFAGHRVVVSEVHGMAQRGGSVLSTVRFGAEVAAPAVPHGEADILLAFEQLEAARHVTCLRPQGVALINDRKIYPSLESLKSARYPEDVVERLRRRIDRVLLVPGPAVAGDLGDPRLANVVLLGALSALLDLPEQGWRRALAELVPPRTVDQNQRAFSAGRALTESFQAGLRQCVSVE